MFIKLRIDLKQDCSDFFLKIRNFSINYGVSLIWEGVHGNWNLGVSLLSVLPYAFTEHGAIMAASVLNTPRAIETSVLVVRAFVRLRKQIDLKMRFGP